MRAHSLDGNPDGQIAWINQLSFLSSLERCYHDLFLRGFRILFPAAVVVNIGMGIGALVIGGHYLTDVLAGILVALATIGILRLLDGRQPETRLPFFHRQTQPVISP